MRLLEKKEDTVNLKSFRNGVLYVKKNTAKGSALTFEHDNVEVIVLDSFYAGNFLINNYIYCWYTSSKGSKFRSVLIDASFNIIKSFPEDIMVTDSSNHYYYCYINEEISGLASLDTDEFVVRAEPVEPGPYKIIYNDEYFIELISDPGFIYIKKTVSKAAILLKIFDYIKVQADFEYAFEFAHIHNNNVIVFIGSYFLIISCETGQIIHRLDIKLGLREFIVKNGVLYARSSSLLAKYYLKDDNLEEVYFSKLQPSEDRKLFLHMIERMILDEDIIWALSRNSTPPFLLKHDAKTGKRIKEIDLRLFGIKEARDVTVTKDKIYISDYSSNVWVFERQLDD